MIPQQETEKILERRVHLLVGVEVFAKNGIKRTSIELLTEKMGISEDEFRKIFRDKMSLVEEICDFYGANSSGSNIVTNDLMDELVNPYGFLKSFVLKIIKKWDSPGDRYYLKFLLSEQPIVLEDGIMSITYYLNDARSLWWMIFEEMINHNFVQPIDPVILANEFITPLFMNRIEYQMPGSNADFALIQDSALAHLGYFWNNVKNTDLML